MLLFGWEHKFRQPRNPIVEECVISGRQINASTRAHPSFVHTDKSFIIVTLHLDTY